jgi:hypothetical protein
MRKRRWPCAKNVIPQLAEDKLKNPARVSRKYSVFKVSLSGSQCRLRLVAWRGEKSAWEFDRRQ